MVEQNSPKSNGERVQKIIAAQGIASRREAEQMIRNGEVTVNGQVIGPGAKAELGKDHIKVRGKLLHTAPRKVVIAFYKPRGMATQVQELRMLLPKIKEKFYPIGALDTDAEGLVLLTNDGELKNRLLQSKFEVPQQFRVKIDGHLEEKKLRRLSKGLPIEGRRAKPLAIEAGRYTEGKQWITLTLSDPRNRLARKLFENVGHPVDKVRRESFAGVGLKGLERGSYRYLEPRELTRLYQWVGLKTG